MFEFVTLEKRGETMSYSALNNTFSCEPDLHSMIYSDTVEFRVKSLILETFNLFRARRCSFEHLQYVPAHQSVWMQHMYVPAHRLSSV